ncbi:MAG: type I polyketide synthase [Cyanobacteria bacterium M_surface_10_m1_298]|nr:type I polyketide synthase [Cyanobacteria bacterium M_surface_10_m1_298]
MENRQPLVTPSSRDSGVPPEPIAIVGIGCRLPGGANSVGQFWDLLRDGRDAISEVPPDRWDLTRHFDLDPQTPLHQHVRHGGFIDGIDQFDPAFFGISPREAVCMDPQQRLLLEVAWQAVEDAGVPLERIRGSETGVFVGISSSDYSSLLWASSDDYAIPDNEPFVLPGNTGCIAANRLSYFFDFKGPSFTVDTACSSSLVAVHLACESLWRGESALALAGGVQALIHPGIQSSFCKAGLLAPDGRCKSFDAAANGYVRSEGAGAVLLKPLSAAQASGDRIYALIHGTAVNSDGRSNGMVAPNLRAQVACVRAAFARAGIAPAATQYVEAHGTGTRQGDPIELRALGTVLGEGRPEGQPCRVGSVKTNLGHSETAAGITGLIKAALCVHHRQLPPSLHFRSPNPSIDFQGLKLQVQTQLEPFPQPDSPAVVGVSSFGFGGTNAHAVLAPSPAPSPAPRYGAKLPLQLLTLSGRTDVALRDQAGQLHQRLSAEPRLSIADVCATANQSRSQFSRRLTALASDRGQLMAQLGAIAQEWPEAEWPAGLARSQASRRPGKLAFLFTGQGSQALGMAQALHHQHPLFREAFDRCADLLESLLEWPLAEVLFPTPGQEELAAQRLTQTAITQPALFVVGYALSQVWLSWGLQPDLLLGHSVGEVLAAHLAGVFSLEDGLRLIAARGRLMQSLPAGGGMAAFLAPPAVVEGLIECHAGMSTQVALAALNGPVNTVVSGPLSCLDQLERSAEAQGIQTTRLAVSHAFHSPAMAPILAEFEQVLGAIRFSAPAIPMVSNLTGRLAGSELAQPDYWCDHVISPVRFADAMAAAAAHGVTTFVEIGARPTLIGMGRQCLPDPELQWWPSLRPGQPDWSVLLGSLAGLHRQGFPIDWEGVHRPFPHRRVALPGYPFQRQRYWWQRLGADPEAPSSLWLHHIKPGASSMGSSPSFPSAIEPPALGLLKPLPLPGGQEQRFEVQLCADGPQDLADHCIRSQVVFPAAGFIQLALQALALQGQPLTLTDLELDQPLRLEPTVTRVQLVFGDRIEFHSCSTTGEGSEQPAAWRSHGTARSRQQPSPPQLSEVPSALQAPPEAQTIDLQGFYGALASFGLNYGPAFRSLRQVRSLGQRAWVEVQRPPGASDWVLWDGCFQAVAATLDPVAAAGQLFLPVGLDALWVGQLPLPDKIQCCVQLLPSAEPAFVCADLQLHAADGLIAWVRGFRLRRLPRQALDWLFPLALDGAPSSEPMPGHRSWLLRQTWEPIETISAADVITPRPEGSTPEPPPSGPGAPLVHWPSLEDSPVEHCVVELIELAQQGQSSVCVVIEGQGPAQGALASLVRTVALERPAFRWFSLHLPKGARRDRLAVPWRRLVDLAEQEPALAWDGQRVLRQRYANLTPARFRYGTRRFGLLESLAPLPLPSQVPAAGELELAVEATGLNFRDVLNALGLLRNYSRQLGLSDSAQVPFGGECVGRVVAVGEGVDPSLMGQRLLAALAVGSLASHVICRAELCVPLPQGLTAEQGASLSTAFLTALYGLEHLAQLQPGETVLIHAAAGGVGQAAVQVALQRGATVFGTASATKQALLLEQGCAGVFDSRSLEFVDQVRAATGGRGVDVVLNSLKGDWVDASFEALAQGGRFVELGKIEIWSRTEVAERRPDVRYYPFDLLEVAAAQPGLIRTLLVRLLEEVGAGVYGCLPLESFEIEHTVDAFRRMAQARHVGKVVIRQPQRPPSAGFRIRGDGTYLVTGAFGGIGLQLVRWLVAEGARSLLLVSRSAADPAAEPAALLRELEAQGVVTTTLALDLAADGATAMAAVDQLIATLQNLPEGRSLRGIFHAAGSLDDGLLEWQTPQRLKSVMAPKWGGWRLVEAALRRCDLDPELLVCFSSVAALLGSPGQAGYNAANGALDGFVAMQGRPGWMSLQWGPWAGAGMAGALDPRQRQRLEAFGIRLLEPSQALEALSDLIARGAGGCIGVVDAEWSRLARQAGDRQGAPLSLLAQEQLESTSTVADSAVPPYRAVLASTPPAERPRLLRDFVKQQLAKVMGLADPQQIDSGEPLFNMGLDSLMALELMVLLEKNLGITLTESLVFEHPTIEELVVYFLSQLFPQAASAASDENLAAAAPSSTALPMAEPKGPDHTPAWSQRLEGVSELTQEDLLRRLRGEG